MSEMDNGLFWGKVMYVNSAEIAPEFNEFFMDYSEQLTDTISLSDTDNEEELYDELDYVDAVNSRIIEPVSTAKIPGILVAGWIDVTLHVSIGSSFADAYMIHLSLLICTNNPYILCKGFNFNEFIKEWVKENEIVIEEAVEKQDEFNTKNQKQLEGNLKVFNNKNQSKV